MEKTRFVDFDKTTSTLSDSSFKHWRERKNDGQAYFIVRPTEDNFKDFIAKIKAKTKKTLTQSKEKWLKQVNPVIQSKNNYFLNVQQAIKENEKYGQKSRCFHNYYERELDAIDAYTRQRLKVAMIHDHPSQRKGHVMKTKWNNEFFARMGLIPSRWLYYSKAIRLYSGTIYPAYDKEGQDTSRFLKYGGQKNQVRSIILLTWFVKCSTSKELHSTLNNVISHLVSRMP